MDLLDQDRTKLTELYFKILENKAYLNEYYEHQDILLKYGYSKQQIAKYLEKGSFNNIEELYYARNPKFGQKRPPNPNIDWEPLVVGGLIGLGLGLIIRDLRKRPAAPIVSQP